MFGMLWSAFGGGLFQTAIHHNYPNSNNEYIIESVEYYNFSGKFNSYCICRRNNDINLVFYRLTHEYQPEGIFSYGKENIVVGWINESEFFVNDETYSVNDFPIHVEKYYNYTTE